MKKLKGKTVLITAGPTREYIDPVRFISNASSGKMGYALAHEAKRLGARVLLVSGHTSLQPPKGIFFIPVVSARQMKKEVDKAFPKADYVVSAAAVSDFRPSIYSKKKIKKSSHPANIKLTRNPDILAELGKKKKHQKLIGFALETNNVIPAARRKLKQKNLDIIFANTPAAIQNDAVSGYLIEKTFVMPIKQTAKTSLSRLLWQYILRST